MGDRVRRHLEDDLRRAGRGSPGARRPGRADAGGGGSDLDPEGEFVDPELHDRRSRVSSCSSASAARRRRGGPLCRRGRVAPGLQPRHLGPGEPAQTWHPAPPPEPLDTPGGRIDAEHYGGSEESGSVARWLRMASIPQSTSPADRSSQLETISSAQAAQRAVAAYSDQPARAPQGDGGPDIAPRGRVPVVHPVSGQSARASQRGCGRPASNLRVLRSRRRRP